MSEDTFLDYCRNTVTEPPKDNGNIAHESLEQFVRTWYYCGMPENMSYTSDKRDEYDVLEIAEVRLRRGDSFTKVAEFLKHNNFKATVPGVIKYEAV